MNFLLTLSARLERLGDLKDARQLRNFHAHYLLLRDLAAAMLDNDTDEKRAELARLLGRKT